MGVSFTVSSTPLYDSSLQAPGACLCDFHCNQRTVKSCGPGKMHLAICASAPHKSVLGTSFDQQFLPSANQTAHLSVTDAVLQFDELINALLLDLFGYLFRPPGSRRTLP